MGVPTSPDEELAEAIVEQLVAQGLIGEEKRAEVLEGLARGTARVEDWRLWIELGPQGQATRAEVTD